MNKEKRITIRLTPEQYDSIRGRADAAQMTVSAYIRTAAMRHKVTVIEGLPEITKQVKALGNNVNQLAVLAHQGRVTAPDMTTVIEKMAAIYAQLSALAEQEKR